MNEDVYSGSIQTFVHFAAFGAGIDDGEGGTPGSQGSMCLRRNGIPGVMQFTAIASGYLTPVGEVPPA